MGAPWRTQPGRSRPDCCGIYLADVVTGVYCVRGHFGGLVPSGAGSQKGQHIDVSMLEIDAQSDLERIAVVAIRGEAKPSGRCSDRSKRRMAM